MPVETWLYFIFGFMILGSIVALEMKDILSAIIAIGVVGLGASIAFLLLQAPDLAIVQFLFEIFALIILVRAFTRKENHVQDPSGMNKFIVGLTVLSLLAILYFSLPVFENLPAFGAPKMTVADFYLQNGAKDTGAANLVASVILDYRAYDTLGEITILFTAILGSLTILRMKNRSKKEGEQE
ncbi:DUF4040 domain-containing protein [candidate division KSB1 bacterium]|nr:DUF4040 domain-containing protein [candidate division KSB1 bacterium]